MPLSPRAHEIVFEMVQLKQNELVFPGMKPGRPLSQMSLAMLLRRMGHGHVTVHGFRSSFRDWAAECTSFPGEVAEMALAHTVSNAVEAAYRRGDMLEKRRKLMEAWEAYCNRVPSAVLQPAQRKSSNEFDQGESDRANARRPRAIERRG